MIYQPSPLSTQRLLLRQQVVPGTSLSVHSLDIDFASHMTNGTIASPVALLNTPNNCDLAVVSSSTVAYFLVTLLGDYLWRWWSSDILHGLINIVDPLRLSMRPYSSRISFSRSNYWVIASELTLSMHALAVGSPLQSESLGCLFIKHSNHVQVILWSGWESPCHEQHFLLSW